MYSHIATGTVAAAIPAAAAASGFAPVHVAVVIAGSATGMAGFVGLLRLAHRGSHLPRSR
jgi:hypothetical protein